MRHLSVSQLSTYARCSEAYRIKYIDRTAGRPAAWFVGGTAFHTSAEVWEARRREIDPVPIFYEAYDQGISRLKEREPDLSRWLVGGRSTAEKDIERRREAGAEQVRSYVAEAMSAPWKIWTLPTGEPAVEVAYRVEVAGLLLVGFIDAILEWPGGVLTVRDYKTGSKIPSPRQLGLYRMAMRETLGEEIDHGDFWSARKGASEGLIDLRRYTHEYLTGLFGALARGIGQKVFLPNPQDGCFTCDVKDHCIEIFNG